MIKFPKFTKKKLTNKESGDKLFFSIEFGRNERSPFLSINTCFLQKKSFFIFLGLKANKDFLAYVAYMSFNIKLCSIDFLRNLGLLLIAEVKRNITSAG